MKLPLFLSVALALTACVDGPSSPRDFPVDVQACKQAMAFRERTTPTFIEVVSAAPLRDGSGGGIHRISSVGQCDCGDS